MSSETTRSNGRCLACSILVESPQLDKQWFPVLQVNLASLPGQTIYLTGKEESLSGGLFLKYLSVLVSDRGEFCLVKG